MNDGRFIRRAIRDASFLIFLAASAGWAENSSPGSLEGKELSAASDVQSGLESVAGTLLAGELKGEVTRVVVAVDDPPRLVVRVSYQGFQGGKIWGEILGGSRKRVGGIAPTEPIVLSDASGEIDLGFEWKPEADGAPSPRSAVLRINVAREN